MGRIMVNIKVQNATDFTLSLQGERSRESIRCFDDAALVDTGANLLCLPMSRIHALGLPKIDVRRVTTAIGKVERRIYGPARLTVLERTCNTDVIELPEDSPPLLGYIPLENLDLVADPTTGTLRGAHGDEIVMDLYVCGRAAG